MNAMVAAQSGAALGTGARWANGDMPVTQVGADEPWVTTLRRNPPTTGTAPMAPTADGSQPTARVAAPTASQAIGAEFSAPASASPIDRGAPVIAAPAQMASPAITCSSSHPGRSHRDLLAHQVNS